MEKKCKVVMLATEEKVDIGAPNWWLQGQKKLIINNLISNLYITSDDEIKDGDYCMSININSKLHKPFKCVNKEAFINPEFLNSVDAKDVKKIIATTDKSLIPLFCKTQTKNIPQISQSFINQYIESYNKGNVITEVTVEYEEYMKQGIFNKGDDTHYFDVKINPDNTINIKLIKDNYSREEVIILLQNVIKDSYSYELEEHHGGDYRNLKKWIEENL